MVQVNSSRFKTIFPTHFIIRQIQCLQSPRSNLFHLPFSRTLRTQKSWMDLCQKNVLLKNKLKAIQKGAKLEQQPWKPSPKKQKIIKYGTATLFASEKILVDLDSFKEIVNRGFTIIDKTLLISEFIECKAIVSLVVRPRRFGKTINLTMLRKFFSIPIYPDNEDYRRELFVESKIMERPDLFDKYFCKYLVIFLSLKDCSGETWSNMQTTFYKRLAELYKKYEYVYNKLDKYEKLNFDKIRSGILQYEITKDALLDLSKYLKEYHRNKCIVLIDEYDHPLNVAYQHQYYEEARSFFASLFGALLKGNDENLEKTLLIGISRITKSGYLSELNNLTVFPMYKKEFANYFGFTEDEIFILLQHNSKESQLDGIRQWYNGYQTGNDLNLYNPWSINSFINKETLEAHWIDTGRLSEFKEKFEKFFRFTMNAFSYYNVSNNLVESNYHIFILGMFHQAYYCGYKLMSNREASESRFDLKIEPTEKVNFKTGVYMEFKVLKYKKNEK
ncbi:DUF1703-domain-containing protein [Rhizophagus irregularis]|uniref:DUF1703-domain-containing protein n=1 Tax=Rhizophagus irregularis TaxID=588596 RepID=A0A2I1HJ99_9GLOM|nr:DUF1703-domain-containing protein [Rhizophagus irregularis]